MIGVSKSKATILSLSTGILLVFGVLFLLSDSGTLKKSAVPDTEQVEDLDHAKGAGADGMPAKPVARNVGVPPSGEEDVSDVPESKELLTEAYRIRASVGPVMTRLAELEGWSYDQLVENILMWEQLCKRVEAGGISNRLGWSADAGMLCDGFVEDWQSHLEDLGIVQREEMLAQKTRPFRLRELIADRAPDAARDLLIEKLDAALRSVNEIEVGEIVWVLGFEQLLRPPLRELRSESYALLDGHVLMSVASALFCDEIGGCGAGHPILLRHCFALPDRPCYQPADFFGAVRQTHTSLEEAAFRSAYEEIRGHLARHRR